MRGLARRVQRGGLPRAGGQRHADGGKCTDADTKKRCGDHLFKSVSGLKTTWDVYEVKFSELTQQTFGLPQTGFDPTGVYSVQFTLANKLAIDIWLDDVTFIHN